MNKKNEAIITAKVSHDLDNTEEITKEVEANGGSNDLLNCLCAIVEALISHGFKLEYVFKAFLKGVHDAYEED